MACGFYTEKIPQKNKHFFHWLSAVSKNGLAINLFCATFAAMAKQQQGGIFMSNSTAKIQKMVLLAMLIALQAILAFTPIGFIMIPPMISITLMHIPVIIGAVILGPTCGGILGFSFGLMSMIKATTSASYGDLIFSQFVSPNPVASIIMCFVPRILLGVIAGFLFILLRKKWGKDILAIGISAAVASLFHTISVLTLMWCLFDALELKAVFTVAFGLNGILELVVGIILSVAISKPLLKYLEKRRS